MCNSLNVGAIIAIYLRKSGIEGECAQYWEGAKYKIGLEREGQVSFSQEALLSSKSNGKASESSKQESDMNRLTC